MKGFYIYSLILECALLYMINCQNSAEQVYSLLSQRLNFENSLLKNELKELKAIVRKQDDKIAAMGSAASRRPDIAEDGDRKHRKLQNQITALRHAFKSEKENFKGFQLNISELESKLKQEHVIGINSSISELESKLEKKLVTEIESSTSELESKFEQKFETEIKPATLKLESKLEEEIAEIVLSTSELESKLDRQKVAFSAKLSTTASELSLGSTIIFDSILHQDGNGYNAADGVFTCPVTGVYMFSVALHGRHEKHGFDILAALLVVDSNIKTYVVSEGHHTGQYHQASSLIILRVHEGQRVWVHSYSKTAKVFRSFSTFSGALLYS